MTATDTTIPTFAVAGRPILASRSAPMFRALFRRQGLRARYTRLSTRDASGLLPMAEALGLAGLNVTAPMKEDVLPALASCQPSVQAVGAANVLLGRDEGWVGANTDASGVRDALALHGVGLAGRTAVVLGAGGAARAALAALSPAGLAQVLVFNRSYERASRIADAFGARALPMTELAEAVRRADLLVSCVPGEPDLVPAGALHPRLWVFDADYRATRLAHAARAAGAPVIPGSDWLALQAAQGFRAFTGRGLDTGAVAWLRQLARVAVPSPAAPLVLCGFMGAGKSSVGPELARRLGWSFADTDALVEAEAGLSVPELFSRHGEARFRELERRLVARALESAGVIALGGGALLDSETRDLLRTRALVVLLWTPLELALERASHGDRPLLADGSDPRELLSPRLASYLDLADLVVSSEHGPPEDVARDVEAELRAAGLGA